MTDRDHRYDAVSWCEFFDAIFHERFNPPGTKGDLKEATAGFLLARVSTQEERDAKNRDRCRQSRRDRVLRGFRSGRGFSCGNSPENGLRQS